jgi:hypothetical protein
MRFAVDRRTAKRRGPRTRRRSRLTRRRAWARPSVRQKASPWQRPARRIGRFQAMVAEQDWRANRANWDERVAIHLGAECYDLGPLRAGCERLNLIEEAELEAVEGLRVLHLQCFLRFSPGSPIPARRAQGPASAAEAWRRSWSQSAISFWPPASSVRLWESSSHHAVVCLRTVSSPRTQARNSS